MKKANSARRPSNAMVLAAGLATRMRPLTASLPKPLVKIAGRALIDYPIAALERAGVSNIVVNVHHLADEIEKHLAHYRQPTITISDERKQLLGSAGGIINALPLLGEDPFFVMNADSFWFDHGTASMIRLAEGYDPIKMDFLLLVVDSQNAFGCTKTDFLLLPNGQLIAAGGDSRSLQAGQRVIYGGAMIVHPRIFNHISAAPSSLHQYFMEALAKQRIYGVMLNGRWFHLSSVNDIMECERLLNSLPFCQVNDEP